MEFTKTKIETVHPNVIMCAYKQSFVADAIDHSKILPVTLLPWKSKSWLVGYLKL